MLERCVGLHVGLCFFVLIFMLDFVLVCASTVLVCASTVLVCASICFFVLARKSTRKHISFGDDSTHATYGTHMYIPVSVNTYVLIQDLADSIHGLSSVPFPHRLYLDRTYLLYEMNK